MREMEKMGTGASPKSKPPRATSAGMSPTPTPSRFEQSGETFNLIAKALLNVSNQVPDLVRDMGDLKSQNAELKNLIWQLSQSMANLSADIATITRAVTIAPPPMNLGPRMRLAGGAPSEQSLREALRNVPGIDNGEK